MALNKRNYIEYQTPITAANLNEIQDAIIEAEKNIDDIKKNDAPSTVLVKKPIVLGDFQYFKWSNIPGNTLSERAKYLARYDVIVYQGELSGNLNLSGTAYKSELELYKKALEYNPNLKVFGYLTARGFANRNGGGHVGMTEYRTSPSNVDHPIWTKEELAAYINLMAHCGGTKDTSTTDEFGNPVLTGGIPLHGVFFDDYDYNFEDDNAHLINQGDWASIREKHNFLVDYCHQCGLAVMPNSNPSLIFDNAATPGSVRNPDGIASHMGENDWFCLESYFLRSDNTFNLNDRQLTDYVEKYRDSYKSKCLALTYVHAVSDDAADNEHIASTFAVYQALCQGADAIALHGATLVTDIPDEFTKYYDETGNAVYTSGSGSYTLRVNGHTITTSRSVSETSYGMTPDAKALATCKITIDGQRVFNNMYVESEDLAYSFETLKESVYNRVDALTDVVEKSSNRYQRALIDDWTRDYMLSDYTNHSFTFENAFGGEDTGATSSWSSFAPYNFTVNLPVQWSWRRVLMDARHLAGKTVELGFETSDAYVSTSVSTKVDPVWQIVGVCESNSNLNITTLNVQSTQKSQVDGVTRCCVRFTMPEDINQLMFWIQRTADSPTGTWTIKATGTYIIDVNEYPIKKTWYTNYAPSASTWDMMHSGYYKLTYGDDSLTVNYTKTTQCYETRIRFPANTTIFKPGETWELGFKNLRLTQPDTGIDMTSKLIIMFDVPTLIPNLVISDKTHIGLLNMKSEVDDDRFAIARFTVPEGYSGGMPATPMYIYTSGYVGGDANGLYELYIEGAYLYKLDERNELFVRGEDPSDTYIGINRVRTDTIDEELTPDTIYVVDDGSMFITNFRGNPINIGPKIITVNAQVSGTAGIADKSFKYVKSMAIDNNAIVRMFVTSDDTTDAVNLVRITDTDITFSSNYITVKLLSNDTIEVINGS